jgi:fatty-acyl-CoA synthase
VGGFPITVSGKVQKFKMREVANEELGLEKVARVQPPYAFQP